jgi:hypothetical protein
VQLQVALLDQRPGAARERELPELDQGRPRESEGRAF